MQRYDSRTTVALRKIVGLLDSEVGLQLVEELEDVTAKAEEQWKSLFEDGDAQGSQSSLLAPDAPKRPGAGHLVLPNDEDEDDAHPEHTAGSNSLHIQKRIIKYFDQRRMSKLETSYQDRGDWSGLKRFEEFGHSDQDHSWMGMLSKNKGATLSAQDYVEATKIRLRIAGPAAACDARACQVPQAACVKLLC